MNTRNEHPETLLLDQMRAGLLDDEPERKNRLLAHLQTCEQCRRRHDWNGTMQPGVLAIQDPHEKLDQARKQALLAPSRSRVQRFIPAAAVAAIALLAVVLVQPVQELIETGSQVASNDTADVPEVYEELDFYLWLADHKDNEDSAT